MTRAAHTTNRRIDHWSFEQTVLIALFIVIAIGAAALLTVATEPPEERRGALTFYAVFAVFLFVMVRVRQAARLYDRVFFGYMRFAGGMLAMIAVPVLFELFSRTVVGRWPLWLQVVCLAAWGVLLAGALALIGTKQMRNRLLERVARFNIGLPAAYSFSVLMLASLFFSSVTFILVNERGLTLDPGSSKEVTLGSLSDFFFWHFFDAIPLFKVPATLKWDVPLTYTSGAVGMIVLLFKVVVITPVIGAFTWYAKRERSGEKMPEVGIQPARGVTPTEF